MIWAIRPEVVLPPNGGGLVRESDPQNGRNKLGFVGFIS